jgi:hypothetical protein
MRSACLYIYVVNRGRGIASVASDMEGRKCTIHLQECVYKHTPDLLLSWNPAMMHLNSLYFEY